jgi:PAS domain S-box-containing protein
MFLTSESVAKKKSFNPWHFIWISVVASEALTFFLNILQSHLYFGESSLHILLRVGAVDSLFVPLIVATVVIYFTRQTSSLIKSNKQLLQTIDERQRIETALRASEQKLSLHVKQTPLGVIEWNLEFNVEKWNPAAEFIFGYSECEAVGANLSFIIPEHYKEAIKRRWSDLIEKKRGMHDATKNITKAGNVIDCDWHNTPLIDQCGAIIGIASFVEDITDHKRLEAEYRTVIQGVSDGFWISDTTGCFIDVNYAYCKLIGYSREELLSMRISDVEAIETQDAVFQHIKMIEKTGNDRFVTRHRRKDGVLVDIEVTVSYLRIKGGRFYVFLRDVTARKKAEETLRISESKYRRLHQSMMDGYVYIDMNGKIEDFNESYQHMLGYNPEELKGLNFRDITPEKWHEWQNSVIKEQVLSRGYSDVYEKEYIKKDGTVIPVEVRTFQVKDDDGNNIGMWAIVRDITERMLAQKEKERRIEEKQRHLSEREGILMDLHDGVGGLVTNIRLLAELSQKMSDKDSVNKTMATISQLAMDAMSEIRGLMHNLDSSEQNWQTLVATLRSEGAAMIESHGMIFKVEAKVDSSYEPGNRLCVNLIRIYKEALTNVIKHSYAKSVAVTIQILNDKLTLEVQDDGIGWSGQPISGRGLSIMKKRAKELEGTVTISAGNTGTRVGLKIPLLNGASTNVGTASTIN